MHPEIQRVFGSHCNCDCIDWNEPGFLERQKSFVATSLSTSRFDLDAIRTDIERLRSGDRDQLLELNQVCGWDWDEEVGTVEALQAILSEAADALVFRLRWNASRVPRE